MELEGEKSWSQGEKMFELVREKNFELEGKKVVVRGGECWS